MFEGIATDIQYSVRSIAAKPGFALVAILTLGLGIGATTAMFSGVHSILFKALPFESAEDILVIRQTDGEDGSLGEGVSAENLRDVALRATTLSHAAIAEAHGLRLIEDGRAYSLRAWTVSEGFFDALGVRARLGRTFAPDEFGEGRDKVVVLGHRTWQTRYGGDPLILGRDLVLDGSAYTVIGVLPDGFKYPLPSDVWAPRPRRPWDVDVRARPQLASVARRTPGVPIHEVQAELDRIATELRAEHPEANANLGLRAIPLREHLFGDVKTPLLLLLSAVALVLLIAAANVAGLQLARGAARSREYALRAALGASALRTLRLVCIENLMLAGAGALVGVGLATYGVDIIRSLAPDGLPRIDEIRIDGTVLAFALVTAVCAALIAGIAPALLAARVDPQAGLSEGTRGTTTGSRGGGLRDRLVIAEIGLALVLMIAAGLLIRSFDRLLDNDLGFDPADRLAIQVWAYDDNHTSKLEFFGESTVRIRALPGVEAVGLTTNLPLADDDSILSRDLNVPFTIDDQEAVPPGDEPVAPLVAIDPDYIDAMGIRLIAGRNFSSADHDRAPPVALVNQAFVRLYLGGREPIGQSLTPRFRTHTARRIVGVLDDVRRRGLESEAAAEIYVPLAQEPFNGLTIVVRTSVEAATLIKPVQQAMWATDPSQASWATRPMAALLGDWNRQRRFVTGLLTAFAVLAVTLAAIGVFGLMSFSVEQRLAELGIRRALGGQTRDILWLILARGLRLGLSGVALGWVGSLAVNRWMRGLLVDTHPFDPLTFGLLSALVVGVTALAAFVPAWRATRVTPLEALRE